jgi:peptidoglycan/xylan/chitin deacetylase (PgdA/CDA1 family)
MPPRWSWDFEDEQRRAAGSDGRRPVSHAVLVRRRRAGAAVLLLVALIAAVAAISASSHGSKRPRPKQVAKAAKPHVPVLSVTQREADAVKSVLAYTPFVKAGSGSARDIALTFDDGPGPYTPEILDVLERYHVRATFFEIGKMLRYFSASTVREIHDGDVIGDHTETHPQMALLSAHEQHEELFEQMLRVEALGAKRPTLFRPPYGSFDATTWRELKKLHLLMVLWSVDTNDYQLPGVPAIVQSTLEGAHPGAIVLMHDGGGDRSETVAALPSVIKDLRARGYTLVTVPELLAADPPAAGQALPGSLEGD